MPRERRVEAFGSDPWLELLGAMLRLAIKDARQIGRREDALSGARFCHTVAPELARRARVPTPAEVYGRYVPKGANAPASGVQHGRAD